MSGNLTWFLAPLQIHRRGQRTFWGTGGYNAFPTQEFNTNILLPRGIFARNWCLTGVKDTNPHLASLRRNDKFVEVPNHPYKFSVLRHESRTRILKWFEREGVSSSWLNSQTTMYDVWQAVRLHLLSCQRVRTALPEKELTRVYLRNLPARNCEIIMDHLLGGGVSREDIKTKTLADLFVMRKWAQPALLFEGQGKNYKDNFKRGNMPLPLRHRLLALSPFSASFADDFARADADPPSGNWQVIDELAGGADGGWQIISNALVAEMNSSGIFAIRYTQAMDSTNYYVECVVDKTADNDHALGPALRVSATGTGAANVDGYAQQDYSDAHYLVEWTNGAEASLASGGTTDALAHTHRITGDGTSLATLYDAAASLNATDATWSTTTAGVGNGSFVSSSLSTVDNWAAADLTQPSSIVVNRANRNRAGIATM